MNSLASINGIGYAEWIILLAAASILILPFWFIFKKAGFHPALSLLMIVPFLNTIMLFYLAFASWPALSGQKEEKSSE